MGSSSILSLRGVRNMLNIVTKVDINFFIPFILSFFHLSFRELLSSDAMKDYNRARVYLDENYKSQEHFTVNFPLSGG